MINTLNIKEAQREYGSYKVGTGPTTVLLVGSCRVAPYLNYFADVNDPRLTVHHIDPCNYHFDKSNNICNIHQRFEALLAEKWFLDLLKDTKWFIHEHYANYGPFNMEGDGNIYSHGMSPEIDLMIPNYNNHFILFQDQVGFITDTKRRVIEDLNLAPQLSSDTICRMVEHAESEVRKFSDVCLKSSFPEMAGLFTNQWTRRRFFWTMNHITAHYTLEIFRMMVEKLKLNVPPGMFTTWSEDDMYRHHFTPVTQFDRDFLGVRWNEPTVELKP